MLLKDHDTVIFGSLAVRYFHHLYKIQFVKTKQRKNALRGCEHEFKDDNVSVLAL